MASMPMQHARRQSQRASTSDQAPHPTLRSISDSPSATSVDSETVFLNEPPSSSATTFQTTQQNHTSSTSHPRTITDDDEPRKCWICFSDETEDTPESSPWRSPCPCALTAHEACLLEWIADLESPDSTRSTVKSTKIQCPQCKSPIGVARANSYVVDAFSAFESFAGRMLLPSIAAGLSYTFILAASHHGAHSIRMVFGTDDADMILAPMRRWTVIEQTAMRYVPTIATPILRGWRGLRVELGLPLIPGALILSRTAFGDALLPVLPIMFFATHPQASQTLSIGYWPPSAALTFVMLPYVRSAYDGAMERLWGEQERKWLKEIKPDHKGDTTETDNAQDLDEDEDVEIVDIGIDIPIPFADFLQPEPQPQIQPQPRPQPQRQAAPPLHEPPLDLAQPDAAAQFDAEIEAQLENLERIRQDLDALQAQQQQAQANPQAQGGEEANPERGTVLLSLASNAGTSVLGALLFPTISAASGELLRLLLPLAWTAARRGPKDQILPPTGLLQTRWGRSVVGGCLFVVLKDAVRIYCRWRMAVSFRERRVREYDKVRKRLLD